MSYIPSDFIFHNQHFKKALFLKTLCCVLSAVIFLIAGNIYHNQQLVEQRHSLWELDYTQNSAKSLASVYYEETVLHGKLLRIYHVKNLDDNHPLEVPGIKQNIQAGHLWVSSELQVFFNTLPARYTKERFRLDSTVATAEVVGIIDSKSLPEADSLIAVVGDKELHTDKLVEKFGSRHSTSEIAKMKSFLAYQCSAILCFLAFYLLYRAFKMFFTQKFKVTASLLYGTKTSYCIGSVVFGAMVGALSFSIFAPTMKTTTNIAGVSKHSESFFNLCLHHLLRNYSEPDKILIYQQPRKRKSNEAVAQELHGILQRQGLRHTVHFKQQIPYITLSGKIPWHQEGLSFDPSQKAKLKEHDALMSALASSKATYHFQVQKISHLQFQGISKQLHFYITIVVVCLLLVTILVLLLPENHIVEAEEASYFQEK
ncbi:MAG: hypothetical protein QM632_02990 [Micrococcaceae bacterium]